MLRNTFKSFGSITKWLHGLIFALVCLQFYLVWGQELFPTGSAIKTQYTLLHKSFGLLLFLIAALFVLWRTLNEKPLLLITPPRWQQIAAKAVHHTLLTLLLLIPMVGYLMACADGRSVRFFNLFTFPCLMPANEQLSTILFLAHTKLGYLLFILICLHGLAALYHHFILKDGILKRILPFFDK